MSHSPRLTSKINQSNLIDLCFIINQFRFIVNPFSFFFELFFISNHSDIIDMDAKTFWGNVKPLIKKNNKTQEILASELEIPFGTFQGWIAKSILPDVVSAYKIARALGVSVEYLVTGRETNPAAETLEKIKALLSS